MNITVALAAEAVTDLVGNGIAAVSATSVTRILPPGKPTLTLAAKDQSIDATVVFAAHGSSNITKYQYQHQERQRRVRKLDRQHRQRVEHGRDVHHRRISPTARSTRSRCAG